MNTEQVQVISRWAAPAEAEQIFGLSRTQLWRLRKAQEIRAAQVGRAVRYDCQSIHDYMTRQAES
jgi:predicted DNA-binding transcriptional regulator AlpA